ncbi:MAG: kynureninase [Candidatus Koribacter versatilis]|uniref:Kynureninase n=1 Tax=Candidatus Korobacter versatilis TaxID=658062 RepID=A0A932EQI3_9BACT|nr:kynureninase [Candidatus Koribacter versatilis]
MPETAIMRETAAGLDARDPLAKYRERFYLPRTARGEESAYLVGHSLGLQPKTARAYLEQELKDWAELGVEAHFRAKYPWMPYHRFLTDSTARLVGAKPGEVVVMNSLTVNLHLMMVSFFRPTAQRHKIVVERGAFPSDQYAIKSQLRFHGLDPATGLIELTPRAGEATLRDEDIRATIDGLGETIALVLLGGVNYSTGQAFDLRGITKAGHAQGCVVAFDCAHAAGNLALKLHDWDVDFAVWCNYKYVNGGPGCVGACFVHERHAHAFDVPRFAGWWGHDEATRFRMGPDFQPMAGAEGWQVSNPAVLSMAALRASLEIFDQAGMEAIRQKSVALTGYLESQLEQHRGPRFTVITPREASRRGAMLSIRISENARRVVERLAEQGVHTDFREPNILRVTPAPLYNSFTDVARFVEQFLAALG